MLKAIFLAVPAALFASVLATASAGAAEPAHLDDRTDATSLVRSLYNAINRHEYARAWDYFGDEKPAADFAAFAQGYEATAEVKVLTGSLASEGAAGSTFVYVPVAILSIDTDGGEKVYAGCYTARFVNPQIQEPPFNPLHIEKGSLQAVETAFEDSVPAQCPDAPAPDASDALLLQAKAAFAATHGDCEPERAPEGEEEPVSYAIPFRYKADGDEQPEGAVDSINIIGYLAADRLVNSAFDEATLSIASHSLWRGVGDASSSGLWIFRDGDFTLVKYEVDASYDGEINPQTVLDYHTAP